MKLLKYYTCIFIFLLMVSCNEHSKPLFADVYETSASGNKLTRITEFSSEGKSFMIKILPDHIIETPAIAMQQLDLQNGIIKCLNKLPPKHREVVIRRFGLFNQEPETLEKVGLAIGLTRERIRQIQADAVNLLHDFLEEEGLDADPEGMH